MMKIHINRINEEDIKQKYIEDDEGKMDYYRNKGYTVVRSPRGTKSKHRSNEVDKRVKSIQPDLSSVYKKGVPDYFCYKPGDIHDFIFVEKKGGSCIARSQIKWMYDNQDLPIEVIY